MKERERIEIRRGGAVGMGPRVCGDRHQWGLTRDLEQQWCLREGNERMIKERKEVAGGQGVGERIQVGGGTMGRRKGRRREEERVKFGHWRRRKTRNIKI